MDPHTPSVKPTGRRPERDAVHVRGFCLTRDRYGTVALRFGASTVPANSLYIERLIEGRGIVVRPNETWPVGADFVKDVLEEALGYLGHELGSLEAMKRQVLRYHVIADDLASEQAKAVA